MNFKYRLERDEGVSLVNILKKINPGTETRKSNDCESTCALAYSKNRKEACVATAVNWGQRVGDEVRELMV